MQEQSRQSYDMAINHIDILGLWRLGEARHTHHLAGYGHNHLRTGVDDDFSDEDVEAFGAAVLFGVGRE